MAGEDNEQVRVFEPNEDDAAPAEATLSVKAKALSARTSLSQEPVDTLAICPAHPDFLVYGTYALVNPDKDETETSARKGSIQVLSVSTAFKPAFAGELPPQLASHSWPSAVVNLHFHPEDPTLLGVATSTAEIYFFRFVKRGDVLRRCIVTELLPLGKIIVDEDGDGRVASLVTHFAWVPTYRSTGIRELDNVLHVGLACTLASHSVKLIKIQIPGIKDRGDFRLRDEVPLLPILEEDIHEHNQEAWFVELLPTHETKSSLECLIFSGGDDSKWITSLLELDLKVDAADPLLEGPIPLWTDSKTHQAGVTAILALPPLKVTDKHDNHSVYSSEFIPILTGSYDDSLRIWCLDPNTPNYKRTLQLEHKTEGGVWRLILLKANKTLEKIHAQVNNDLSEEDILKNKINPELYPIGPRFAEFVEVKSEYLILVANMWKHAKILRITFLHGREAQNLPPESEPEFRAQVQAYEKTLHPSGTPWKVETVAELAHPHESLVYAVDGVKQERRLDIYGQWDRKERYTIATGSFYDHKICVWEYVVSLRGAVD